MHELSIAQSLVEMACEQAERENATRVLSISIRIGALAGVVKEALLFSFDLAVEGTICEGASLAIEEVPITVLCPVCDVPRTLTDAWHFMCPVCGTPTSNILSGRELDLSSIEIEDHVAPHP